MLSAARSASCTCQKITASTLTGTVTRLSACSALNAVVWMRSSMIAVTVSRIGMMRNNPGPRTPCNRPARKTTNRSQLFAILREAAINPANTKNAAPATNCDISQHRTPSATQMAVRNAVIGDISILLHGGVLKTRLSHRSTETAFWHRLFDAKPFDRHESRFPCRLRRHRWAGPVESPRLGQRQFIGCGRFERAPNRVATSPESPRYSCTEIG